MSFANFFLGLYAVEIIGFFSIGLLVILRQKASIYKKFATFAFLVGGWQLLQFMALLVVEEHALAVNCVRASIAVSGLMASSFLIFALSYSGLRTVSWLVYFIGGGVGLLTLLSNNLRTLQITSTGIGVPKLDIWYGVLLVFAAICIFCGVGAILWHLKHATTKKQRSQDKVMLGSTFTAGLIIIFFSFHTSDFSTGVLGQHIVPMSCLMAMLGFLYAMIYHDLFDIHGFVIRAAAYLTTLFVITAFCITPLVILFERVAGLDPPIGITALTVAAFALIIYLLQWLRSLFDRATTRLFFRNYYEPQDVLSALSEVLVQTVDVEVLSVKSAEILGDALKPDFIRYILFASPEKNDVHFGRRLSQLLDSTLSTNSVIADEDIEGHHLVAELFKRENLALVIKLRTPHEHLGYILVGYRKSGEIYSPQDKRLLSTAADEIAIALQNAIRFEEIEQFNITLQQKIDDATRRLRQSNAKLKTLDETKDDFISMASHQLRTPLTSVKGYVSMVLDGDAGKLTPLQRKLLNQAFVSSQRMVYLISDLLNLSRLRTGKFVIEENQVNLANIIKDEVSQLQETARSREVELTYNKPEHFPTLKLDETKMRQVIMNFIDNAIYYTPAGGHITINLIEKPKSFEFTVVDDGIGVPRREQHHLFTKFYRAHNAKRARPDGTGLGLFMAKKVVVAQGGAIIFRSQEGKGSTFGFTFSKERVA